MDEYTKEVESFYNDMQKTLPEKESIISGILEGAQYKCYQANLESPSGYSQCMMKFRKVFEEHNQELEFKTVYGYYKLTSCLSTYVKIPEEVAKCKSRAKADMEADFNNFLNHLSKL